MFMFAWGPSLLFRLERNANVEIAAQRPVILNINYIISSMQLFPCLTLAYLLCVAAASPFAFRRRNSL